MFPRSKMLAVMGIAPEIHKACPTITPVVGPGELLTDGGLENWINPTNLTSWTEVIGGTSTVNQEAVTVHGGVNAARLDVDAGGTLVSVRQQIVNAVDAWVQFTAWLRASAANKTGAISRNTSSPSCAPLNPGAAYTQYKACMRFTTANVLVDFKRYSAASASLYWDDLSAGLISDMAVFVGNAPRKNGIYQCRPTCAVNSQCGFLVEYTNANNFVAAYIDRSETVTAYLYNVVNGVWSLAASGVVVYGAANILKVIVNGTTHSLYYNGVQVGLDAAIANAAFGLGVYGFSTLTGNDPGLVTTSAPP